MSALKIRQTGEQPVGGKPVIGQHGQAFGRVAGIYGLHGRLQPAEHICRHSVQNLPRITGGNPPMNPAEQGQAQNPLQLGNLLAYGGLGHAQLCCRGTKTAAPAYGFQNPQGAEQILGLVGGHNASLYHG